MGHKLDWWKGLLTMFKKNESSPLTEEEQFSKYVEETEHQIKVLRSTADVRWARGDKKGSAELHDKARELGRELLNAVRSRIKGQNNEI